jgi:hypothetical protein
MLTANILATGVNCNFFNMGVVCSWERELPFLQTVSKVHGKFSLSALSTPSIIVPVFSEQPQQHCLSIITILAGKIKHSYLRDTIGENIFCIKTFYTNLIFRFLS